jgi:hypothetical protein
LYCPAHPSLAITYSYYGSRHGKNRCDGEGGILKSKVTRAIKNGEAVINNAEKFADHCKETLTKGNRFNDKCNQKRRSIAAVLSVPGPIVCSFSYYAQIFQGITHIHKCSLAFVLSSTSITRNNILLNIDSQRNEKITFCKNCQEWSGAY